MISDIRKLWYYAIGISVITVITAYLIGTNSVGTEWQAPACLTLAAMLAIIPPLILALPEPFGIVAIIGFLNGMIPGGLRPGESVEVALKTVFQALAYVALANSFMLFFFGTWDFGPFPGAAKLILVAAMVLTCWAAVHKEGEWFKKISLWYPAAVIAVAIAATLVPGIVPGKAERALKQANQALVDAQNEVAKKQIDEIMGHIEILRSENDPKNVRLIEEDAKKVEWIERNLTRKGSVEGFFTDPAHQPPSSWVVAVTIIFAVFWVLKKYPRATNVIGTLFLLTIIILAAAMAYREWNSLEKLGQNLGGFMRRAVSHDITFTRLDEKKTVYVPPGEYTLESSSSRNDYWAKCPGGRMLSLSSMDNEATRELFKNDSIQGNVVVRSGNMTPINHGTIFIQDEQSSNVEVSISTTRDNKDGCAVASGTLPATLRFVPRKNR